MRYGTLNNDFYFWWRLGKYKNQEILAKELYGDQEVIEQIPDVSGKMWQALGGEETDVKYYVRLKNGVHVGFREPRTDTGRRKKYAEFPIVEA